jgi:hypothetical protein
MKGREILVFLPLQGGGGVKKLQKSEKELPSERMVGLKKISSGTLCDSAAMA